MRGRFARWVAALCAVLYVSGTVVFVSPGDRELRTEDRNADGRPDAWRWYDRQGQLAEVDLDQNLDGRPDIEEYYDRGVLVRRESDRNFDGRVDLTEEFDPTTHEQIKAIVDEDYDGRADLLVLFTDGHPVAERRAGKVACVDQRHPIAAVPSGLVPLADPFRDEPAVSGIRFTPADTLCAGLTTSGGLPTSWSTAASPLSPIVGAFPEFRRRAQSAYFPRSPRGPPLS